MKTTITKSIRTTVLAICFLFVFVVNASSAHAWVYVGADIEYEVINQLPTANAGPDQSTTFCSVTLTGTASDPDGTIVSSYWMALSTPTGAPTPVFSPNTGTPANNVVVISNLTTGTYVFMFNATDNDGASAYDTVSITITANPCVNRSGPDVRASTPAPNTATLNVQYIASYTVTNIGNETTGTGNFQNLFQIDNNADHSTITASTTMTMLPLAGGASAQANAAYTFTTGGTWYVRACADSNATLSGTAVDTSSAGTITEANEINNCSPWTTVVVPTGLWVELTADPTTITRGDNSYLQWESSPGIIACSGQGWGAGNTNNLPPNMTGRNSITVSPANTRSYTITCQNNAGTQVSDTVTVTVLDLAPQCRDRIDNDGDRLADRDDPGCHTDNNPNNPQSYEPDHDDETDIVPQCSDGVDNDDVEDVLIDENDPGCYLNYDMSNPSNYRPDDDDEYHKRKTKFIEF